MTTSQEEWRRPAAALGRLVCARGFCRVAGCPLLLSQEDSYGFTARVANPRGARGSTGSRHLAETNARGSIKAQGIRAAAAPTFVSVRRKQLKAHFGRQIRAKSNQVLSAAAPVSFIFCHSSPHACIRARDAGGKVRGCGGGSGCGLGASIGAAEIAGAEGKPIVARPPAGPAGRAGGSGAVNDGFDFSTASRANAGRRAS